MDEIVVDGKQIQLAPLFYADDGVFFGLSEETVAKQVDKFAEVCKRFGLHLSQTKSKVVAYNNGVREVIRTRSALVSARNVEKRNAERNDGKAECPICRAVTANNDSAKRSHQESAACVDIRRAQFSAERVAYVGAMRQAAEVRSEAMRTSIILPTDGNNDSNNNPSRPVPIIGEGFPPIELPRHRSGAIIIKADKSTDINPPLFCPAGCPNITFTTRTALQFHVKMVHCDQVLFLPVLNKSKMSKDDPLRHTTCRDCGMAIFSGMESETRPHEGSDLCKKRVERLANYALTRLPKLSFPTNPITAAMEIADPFVYLGRPMTSSDMDRAAINRNCLKTKQVVGRFWKMRKHNGTESSTRRRFVFQ
jgi:hypothetical protein